VPADDVTRLEAMAAASNVPLTVIGNVGGSSLKFGDAVSLLLADAEYAWKNGYTLATSD